MKASKLRKGESLKINGRFNTCHIKCVDVVKYENYIIINAMRWCLKNNLGHLTLSQGVEAYLSYIDNCFKK